MAKPSASVGKYSLERLIGQGAVARVYAVRDSQSGRPAALKVLSGELARQPEIRERFLREGQVTSTLRHPNIATVYEIGEVEGLPFIAMELVEGDDLARLIARRALSLEWRIDVLRQLCEGLAYAHVRGVVHRDVKPGNLRLTPEGILKIMDFGLARIEPSSLTRSGMLLGSILYTAPEQIEGRAVDQRADVFSVGAVAYELIACRKPFEGDSLTAIMTRIVSEPADFSAFPSTRYSPQLEAIVSRALEREPDLRYPSLMQMRADLAAAVRAAAALS